jgi:hypothetical protein
MLVIAEARERMVPYATALRASIFVKNTLTWYAYFLVGQVQRAKHVCEYFEIAETEMTYAVVRFKRVGRPEQMFKYTLQEAERAGFYSENDRKSAWGRQPRVMLRWAAMREAARAYFPDVVGGMYTPDEMRDGQITAGEFEQTEAGFEAGP